MLLEDPYLKSKWGYDQIRTQQDSIRI